MNFEEEEEGERRKRRRRKKRSGRGADGVATIIVSGSLLVRLYHDYVVVLALSCLLFSFSSSQNPKSSFTSFPL
jgi:hypothetical protein